MIILFIILTEPAPMGVLIVSDCDTTSIEVLWANPNNPNVIQYIVSLVRLDGATEVMQTIPVGMTTTPVYRLTGLIPGREYHISVAFAGTDTVLTAIQSTRKCNRVINKCDVHVILAWCTYDIQIYM